eukprot:symbB.v1.2.033393.t1/scaffold4117.1/size72747/2
MMLLSTKPPDVPEPSPHWPLHHPQPPSLEPLSSDGLMQETMGGSYAVSAEDAPSGNETSQAMSICPNVGSFGHPFICSKGSFGERKDGKCCIRCHLCHWSKPTRKVEPLEKLYGAAYCVDQVNGGVDARHLIL